MLFLGLEGCIRMFSRLGKDYQDFGDLGLLWVVIFVILMSWDGFGLCLLISMIWGRLGL